MLIQLQPKHFFTPIKLKIGLIHYRHDSDLVHKHHFINITIIINFSLVICKRIHIADCVVSRQSSIQLRTSRHGGVAFG